MQEIVSFIKRYRLEEPVLWMIEAHRPIRGLAYHTALVAQPAAALLGFGKGVSALAECLESPEKLEQLVGELERTPRLASEAPPFCEGGKECEIFFPPSQKGGGERSAPGGARPEKKKSGERSEPGGAK